MNQFRTRKGMSIPLSSWESLQGLVTVNSPSWQSRFSTWPGTLLGKVSNNMPMTSSILLREVRLSSFQGKHTSPSFLYCALSGKALNNVSITSSNFWGGSWSSFQGRQTLPSEFGAIWLPWFWVIPSCSLTSKPSSCGSGLWFFLSSMKCTVDHWDPSWYEP